MKEKVIEKIVLFLWILMVPVLLIYLKITEECFETLSGFGFCVIIISSILGYGTLIYFITYLFNHVQIVIH